MHSPLRKEIEVRLLTKTRARLGDPHWRPTGFLSEGGFAFCVRVRRIVARLHRDILRGLVDLLPQVWARIEQDPIPAVGAHRHRGWVRALSPAPPLRTPAEFRPLQFHCGKAAACRRPEHFDQHDGGLMAAGPPVRQALPRKQDRHLFLHQVRRSRIKLYNASSPWNFSAPSDAMSVRPNW